MATDVEIAELFLDTLDNLGLTRCPEDLGSAPEFNFYHFKKLMSILRRKDEDV